MSFSVNIVRGPAAIGRRVTAPSQSLLDCVPLFLLQLQSRRRFSALSAKTGLDFQAR
jgi:hypothetical protein